MALVDLDGCLAGHDAQIVYILHDEIIVEAREDVADCVAAVAKECMERTFAEIFPEVPFVVILEIKDTWGTIILKNFKLLFLSDFYLSNIIGWM